MAIDPIILALCRGQNDAGDTALPVVKIDTTIPLSGEHVKLTAVESKALSSLPAIPVIIYCYIEEVGGFGTVYASVSNAFAGSLAMGGYVIMVEFSKTNECIDNSSEYYWQASWSGGTLNPIPSE